MPGDALEGRDLLLRRLGEVLLGLVELAFALEQLAVALLEHLRALVELLVALDQATLLGRELVAPGPRFFFGLTRQAKLLVLCLEDELLLAGPCFGLDAAGFRLRGLHALGGPHRAAESAK